MNARPVNGLGLAPEEELGFWDSVAGAEDKIADFRAVYAELRGLRPTANTDAALATRYTSLMDRGEGIRQKVRIIEDLIARGRAWIDDLTPDFLRSSELEGLGAARHRTQQLGVAPLVLWGIAAAITAALAYVTSWIGEAVVLRDRLAARESVLERVDAGTLSPAEAERIIDAGLDSGDGFSAMGIFQVIAWGAAAAGAIYLARTLKG